jgi:hypothetical protein
MREPVGDLMTNTDFSYAGGELELFKDAVNWKGYFASQLRPFIKRRVVEVGAGIGATTAFLCDGGQECWVCVEPDKELAKKLNETLQQGGLPGCCSVRCGTVDSVTASGELFDTVLYIDVLEHIEADRDELIKASSLLTGNGALIVLAPAFNMLFSPFDQAVGHFRRYTRLQLKALTPPELRFTKGFYLDSIGFLASLGNRILLSRSMPTARQIQLWDRVMVPVSRIVDPLIRYSFGRSVIAIWQQHQIRALQLQTKDQNL